MASGPHAGYVAAAEGFTNDGRGCGGRDLYYSVVDDIIQHCIGPAQQQVRHQYPNILRIPALADEAD